MNMKIIIGNQYMQNQRKNHQNVIDVGEMDIINHHVMLRNILKVSI